MNALMTQPVFVASAHGRQAESYYRYDLRGNDMRLLKIIRSEDALRGQEGTGKTLYVLQSTFNSRAELGAIVLRAKAQRFTVHVV